MNVDKYYEYYQNKYEDSMGKNILERVSRQEDNYSDKRFARDTRKDILYASPVLFKPLNMKL